MNQISTVPGPSLSLILLVNLIIGLIAVTTTCSIVHSASTWWSAALTSVQVLTTLKGALELRTELFRMFKEESSTQNHNMVTSSANATGPMLNSSKVSTTGTTKTPSRPNKRQRTQSETWPSPQTTGSPSLHLLDPTGATRSTFGPAPVTPRAISDQERQHPLIDQNRRRPTNGANHLSNVTQPSNATGAGWTTQTQTASYTANQRPHMSPMTGAPTAQSTPNANGALMTPPPTPWTSTPTRRITGTPIRRLPSPTQRRRTWSVRSRPRTQSTSTTSTPSTNGYLNRRRNLLREFSNYLNDLSTSPEDNDLRSDTSLSSISQYDFDDGNFSEGVFSHWCARHNEVCIHVPDLFTCPPPRPVPIGPWTQSDDPANVSVRTVHVLLDSHFRRLQDLLNERLGHRSNYIASLTLIREDLNQAAMLLENYPQQALSFLSSAVSRIDQVTEQAMNLSTYTPYQNSTMPPPYSPNGSSNSEQLQVVPQMRNTPTPRPRRTRD
jgi:hypothetical protein